MNNKHCSFKHKRGSKDGYFCCRNIRTKLIDNKKDYLCVRHSKKHIPNKRNKKEITTKLTKSNKNNSNILKENDVKIIDTKDRLYNNTNIKNISIIDSINLIENNKKEKVNVELLEFDPHKFNNSNITNDVYINKNNNTYKKVINNQCIYTELIKEIPLLDFCINKLKKIKNKRYANYYNLL